MRVSHPEESVMLLRLRLVFGKLFKKGMEDIKSRAVYVTMKLMLMFK